jgi:hypothetical protein
MQRVFHLPLIPEEPDSYEIQTGLSPREKRIVLLQNVLYY